jgi:competence protein ComEC
LIEAVLFFLAGIVSVQHLNVLPNSAQLIFLGLMLAVLVWLRFSRPASFVAGFVWAVLFAIQGPHSLEETLQGQELRLNGRVVDLPVVEADRTKFNFVVERPGAGIPDKLRLSWYYPQRAVKAGQYWQLTVKLKQAHGRFNPGTFDYEFWLFSQGVGATGYVRNKPEPRLIDDQSIPVELSVWRQSIAERLQQILGTKRYQGLITALTMGDRSKLSQEAWEVLRKTGTVHLVAISGLHVGLVAGLVYLLTFRGWSYVGSLSISPAKISVILALFTAIFYAALAGFALPTRRALIMIVVVFSALYLQRNVTSLHTLGLALLAILILDPLAVSSASFWLSFAAVLLILYSLSSRLERVGYWRSAIKIHWVTALGLAPLVMLYFQQVSLIAPLANLIAVPIISLLVVPIALLATLFLLALPELSSWLFSIVDWIVHYLWILLTVLSELGFVALNTIQPPVYAVCLAFVGILLILAPKGIPARYLGVLLCLPVVFPILDKPPTGEFRLTLLDVGQGLASIVETNEHVLVFDTGAKYSDQFDMGSAVVIPVLRYRGVNSIDKVVISHGDNDHKGGLQAILNAMPVGEVISSETKIENLPKLVICQRGLQWAWDRVTFEFLAPPQAAFSSENDNSCVLRVTNGRQTILLTGDIEQEAEGWLVDQYGSALASSVLISPHHGSRTSSGLEFLQHVDPDVVLIPAGFRNRFAFPHQEVLQRYQAEEIAWMNTADQGAVTVTTRQALLQIESSRKTNGHYWNAR